MIVWHLLKKLSEHLCRDLSPGDWHFKVRRTQSSQCHNQAHLGRRLQGARMQPLEVSGPVLRNKGEHKTDKQEENTEKKIL